MTAIRGSRLLLALVLLLASAAATSPARAADPVNVTVTILRVIEVQNPDPGLGQGFGDYFSQVRIGGGGFQRSSTETLADAFVCTGVRCPFAEPVWTFTRQVDRDATPSIPIQIQLWDDDDFPSLPDDVIDINPADGVQELSLSLDLTTGSWTGDVPANRGFAEGDGDIGNLQPGFSGLFDGGERGALLFDIALGADPDLDDDGIPDGVERFGIRDDSGNVVVDLAALGANPCRKTIAVEVDFMGGAADGHTHRPQAAAIAEAVTAFNAAPVPAVATCPYSGVSTAPGVDLLVDVSNQIPEQATLSFANNQFKNVRDANFNVWRRPYFHYSLWAHDQAAGNSSSGLCCSDSGKDVLVTLGSWAGQVGTVRDQSGTFVHELGHALGLGHGGVDSTNCKPNYLSIMSYVYQTTGIPDASLPAPTADLNGDGVVDGRDRFRLDLSRDKLNDLDEDALSENAGIGGGPDTFFWDGDGAAPWRASAGNVPVDWDRDTPTAIDPGTVAADVNFMGIPSAQGCPTATLPPGTVGTVELFGFDDWANLKYQALLSAPSSGVPSTNELDKPAADFIKNAVREALSLADLTVTLTDAPDPVAAGNALTYTLQARNQPGPNTAYAAALEHRLPPDVTFTAASPGCTHSSGTVRCALGNVAPGQTATRTVTVAVPADLVAVNGSPKTITSTATVRHDGPDADSANNTASAATRVIAVADAQVTQASTTGPSEVLLGSTGTFTHAVTIDNAGPSSPVDTTLSATVTGSPGVTTSPTTSTSQQPALQVGAPRTVTTTSTVTCREPGLQTVTLAGRVALRNAADVDPDLSNNTRSTTTQVDCVIPIVINVRPQGFPNSINLNTDATLAALTTRAGEYGLPRAVDATTIQAGTVQWGLRANLLGVSPTAGAPESHGQIHPERSYELDERTRDADLDAVLHFKPALSGLQPDTTEACLKGRLQDPTGTAFTFFGCDSVRVIG